MSADSICFSNTVNLRCASFDKNNYLFLNIPTFLELIFSLTLAISRKEFRRCISLDFMVDDNYSRDHRNWLLVLEGWSFLLLAVIDIIAHRVDAIQYSKLAFKIVDITIGM
jgi:hypothetical protein